MSREFDVIVYGATGFVGKLTAGYLSRQASPGTRIALAGRSQDRLDAVRREIGGRALDWRIVVADSSDDTAVRAMAERATTIATTVGPYAVHGFPLARACAEAGTHYADLTGEVLFMRRTVDELHEVARASGARIVHACGFDSIPSDLGVLVLRERVREELDEELGDTTFVVTAVRGGMSGGTAASMTHQLAQMQADPAVARVVEDTYALSPARDEEPDVRNRSWPSEADLRGVAHDRGLGMWLAPFAMAGVNTRVVRRSNALLDWDYGRQFRYREAMGFRGVTAPAKAAGVVGALAAFMGAMAFPPTRAVAERLLPDPGNGPSEETRRNGFFRVEIHTTTPSGARFVCHVAAKGDPGYQATSVMLGEAALALALDELPAAGGVLTPATGIGMPLVDRLRAQQFTFSTERR